ncbi:elongation factor [Rhynchospora pubera]|uniref:Elongation factor n=1 Tax=Rhynchospora pubera TaxID=906938 RepID=A0AAV8C5I7_9POAL|nr:elongation factor [Rhynchospora pubera]KAJ4796274.1 elongation factor [Rhynchospora pubera]
MVGAHGAIPMEVVGTMIEVADVAWHALEHRKHRVKTSSEPEMREDEEELEMLRSENLRLKAQLADNLAVLQSIYKAPSVSKDCPPDLYERLIASVDSSNYLKTLESLQEPVVEPTNQGSEENSEDVSINVDGELSWWVWVTEKLDPQNLEEPSGIDNDNYVIISEENVIDGIASFIARCILENPESKTLSPQELHKAVTRAIAGIKERMSLKNIWEAGKVIYSLSTWGIFLAGLYRQRAIVKVAAKGVATTSKFVMKML